MVWFNVSVSDKRRLFRPNYVVVYLRLVDLNDNSPKFDDSDDQDEIALDLDVSSIQATHESALIGDSGGKGQLYFLIYNRSASDPDTDSNGTLSYFLQSVHADNIKFESWPKFFVSSTSKLG